MGEGRWVWARPVVSRIEPSGWGKCIWDEFKGLGACGDGRTVLWMIGFFLVRCLQGGFEGDESFVLNCRAGFGWVLVISLSLRWEGW